MQPGVCTPTAMESDHGDASSDDDIPVAWRRTGARVGEVVQYLATCTARLECGGPYLWPLPVFVCRSSGISMNPLTMIMVVLVVLMMTFCQVFVIATLVIAISCHCPSLRAPGHSFCCPQAH